MELTRNELALIESTLAAMTFGQASDEQVKLLVKVRKMLKGSSTIFLKNGTQYIEGNEHYVIARTEGVMPYVTWAIDAEGHTYWGHYFKTLNEAVKDFNQRVAA